MKLHVHVDSYIDISEEDAATWQEWADAAGVGIEYFLEEESSLWWPELAYGETDIEVVVNP